ncbi:MAG: hypothetical protein J6A78_02825 [Clostridia bacterium]|nr:hypothetical protein [Clostridia bacterium]
MKTTKNSKVINNSITEITEKWKKITYGVLDLKQISSAEIRENLKKTYEVLNYYHKDEYVPKSVCEMLLEMDSFLYFASMITDKEFDDDPYLYQVTHSIAQALKEGFLKGKYEYEYPVLKIINADNNPVAFNLQNGYLEDLL